ncbi:Remorin_C domain-containing protein [Cephalotus follicularis]|uniref:Remorin_C domain-containing protein n=1 Tax=Cephalotus follicularis TaxID=3775 RepID=A0A1Q3BCX8_CEPFO|nr:Remorin_C domain-containing protein [Cephalotus follicularis]
MDLTSPKYLQSPSSSLFASNGEPPLETNTSFYGKSKDNPFADAFPDPLCKLNLRETSEFVKTFPMAAAANNESTGCFLDVSSQRKREGVNSDTQRRVEAPPTPGRPIFSFSVGALSRKSFPSKWDDADKWLISTSCNESPAHAIKPSDSSSKIHKQWDVVNSRPQMEVFAEKSRVTEEKVSKIVSSFQTSASFDHHSHNSARALNGVSGSADVPLKDKFTDDILPNFRYSEPSKEGFLLKNSACEKMRDAGTEVIYEVQHRDVGTEMTPLSSSTTSTCHTPFKSSSPARHNTPASRSGPLAMGSSNSTNSSIDITQLKECHLAKLHLGTKCDSVTSNWSSREEEEEEISKSLRHFETGNGCHKSVSDSRAAAWEEEEKNKSCLRYQREEAKIQAWVNLQSAKAEAQSRKLEVKIQRMRSNLEEKLMKRMAVVHRRAEELRVAARQQHSEQLQRASEQAQKMINPHISGHKACGCFPRNN